MELEDYKEIISTYQQKCFEFFNENIVLKTQINSVSKKFDDTKVKFNSLLDQNESLTNEINTLRKDFELLLNENKSLNKVLVDLQGESDTLSSKNDLLTKEIESLKNNSIKLKQNLSPVNKKTSIPQSVKSKSLSSSDD